MKSGRWLLAAVAAAVMVVTAPAGLSLAAEKGARAPVYNKGGGERAGGPVSFSGSRAQGGSGIDELPLPERMKQKKAELYERIAAAAYEREVQTQALVDRANAEVMARAGQESQRDGGYGYGGYSSSPQKNYVYNPSGKKKKEAPSIVVPNRSEEQNSSGPFNVFKFNKKKE